MAELLDKADIANGYRSLEDDIDNPLLNHLIVSKVLLLGKLNFDELKRFRLVCSLWYTLSLDQWRQSVFLMLVENRDNQMMKDSSTSGVALDEFYNLSNPENLHVHNGLLQLTRKPYSYYKLKGWMSTCPKGSKDTEKEAHLWASKIATLIRYLEIEDCYFPDSKLLEEKLFSCVNLEELSLVGNSSGICRGYKIPTIISDELPTLTSLKSLTVNGAMPLQWSKLLLHTPNVEILTIKQNGSYYRTTFASFLLDLHQLEFSGRNPKNIKHLDIIDADDTFTDFVSLSSRDLKLESLSIQFDQVRPEHFMQPLLHAQARTLKVLKLSRISDREEQPFGQFEFPYSVNMTNLREIYLWGDIVKNLGFLRNTPNLQCLHISRERYGEETSLNGKLEWEMGTESRSILEALLMGHNEILPEMYNLRLNEMEVLHLNCRVSVDSVKILIKIMPNVKVIKTVLSNETLKVVCDGWPFIKEIHALYESDIDDSGISRIFSMTDLVKFKVDAYFNKSKLTDSAFLNIADLCKWKGFKSLNICVSEKMSIETETAVRRSLPLSEIWFERNYKRN